MLRRIKLRRVQRARGLLREAAEVVQTVNTLADYMAMAWPELRDLGKQHGSKERSRAGIAKDLAKRLKP